MRYLFLSIQEMQSYNTLNMLYNKFFEKCFAKIKHKRQHIFKGKVQVQTGPLSQEHVNLYIQVFYQKGKKYYKLQQWNFITLTQLMGSEYGQEEDPQLDSFNIHERSFLSILQEILHNLSPKLLIRTLEPQKLKIRVCENQQQLQPFSSETTYLKQIDEYETQNYKCKVSLKYDYQVSEDVKIMSSQEEFELLVDESFQNDRIDKIKEERKMSEDVLKANRKKSEMEEYLHQKKKKTQKIEQIKQMISHLEENQTGGKTLQQFIKTIQ